MYCLHTRNLQKWLIMKAPWKREAATGLRAQLIRSLGDRWHALAGDLRTDHPAFQGCTLFDIRKMAKLAGFRSGERVPNYFLQRALAEPGFKWDVIEILPDPSIAWSRKRLPTAKLRLVLKRQHIFPVNEKQRRAQGQEMRPMRLHKVLFVAADPDEIKRLGEALAERRTKVNRENAMKPRPRRKK